MSTIYIIDGEVVKPIDMVQEEFDSVKTVIITRMLTGEVSPVPCDEEGMAEYHKTDAMIEELRRILQSLLARVESLERRVGGVEVLQDALVTTAEPGSHGTES